MRAAAVLVLLAACGGRVEATDEGISTPDVVTPAACVTDAATYVCDDSLPIGVTVQFLDTDGGILSGCRLGSAEGEQTPCVRGAPCRAISAPDGRETLGRCSPAGGR